jgi:diguanylate cyclase (GGDEF)-like protein
MVFMTISILLENVPQVLLADDIQSEEQTQNETVVRVAYVLLEDFQEGGEGERKYGYGYEYLQMISYYTGWKYEYVYGDFQESLDRLISGEVDLMANISYTDARAEQINFSALEQGTQTYYVFGLEDQTKIDPNDLTSLNGLKIGVNAGGFSADYARQWCAEKGITCELIDYADADQRIADMENGVIDAVIASEIYTHDDWIPLMELGENDYYFGVAKERNDLLEELNQAMRQIKTVNPFYNNYLKKKYISQSSVVTNLLSDTEKEWLEEKPVVRIGYLDDYMPYSGTNKDTGNADGLLVDFLANVRHLYSLDYELQAYDSCSDLKKALADGEIDASFPAFGDYSLGEDLDLMISDVLTQSTMMIYTGNTTSNAFGKIAITRSDPFQEQYAQIYYPDAEFLICDNISDCVQAVMNGKADCTLVETARANEAELGFREEQIQRVNLQESVNISFAVRSDRKELFTILNKGILATDESLIKNSLIYHAQNEVEYTAADFIREHGIVIILILTVVFSFIIILLVHHQRAMKRNKIEILEAYHQIANARWTAAHDPMTGLLNRSSFDELCSQLKETKQPYALLAIDIDHLGAVNEIHGHKTGDKTLMKVARLLDSYFRPQDRLIRYAGAEFVVIMPDTVRRDEMMIFSLIEKINKILKNPDDEVPQLSISVGIAFSESGYTDDLLPHAERALFLAKENGRCNYEVYDPEK